MPATVVVASAKAVGVQSTALGELEGKKMSAGGCLCGRVRYSATGEPESSLICHCVSCRRAAGAQSVAWVTFSAGGFSWVSGDPVEHRSSAEVSRTFCGNCGTSLTYQHDADPDFIDVSTASLDDPTARVASSRALTTPASMSTGGCRPLEGVVDGVITTQVSR